LSARGKDGIIPAEQRETVTSLKRILAPSGQTAMDFNEIVFRLQNELPHILAHRPVLLAYLYGSLARGQATPLSDVDIALVTEQPLPPLTRLDLELDVEVKLSALGISQVDVRVINQAPPVVRGRVVTEGRLLYCRDEKRRVDFESQARTQYFDLQPLLREQRQTYFRAALADLQARGLYDS
jgi:predicted nucleotidyltransferase